MADLKLDDKIDEVTGLGNTATGWATKVQNLLNSALKSNLNPFGTAATKDIADVAGGSSEQGKIPVLDADGKVPDVFINIPEGEIDTATHQTHPCLLYTSPSPRDRQKSRMPSSA